MFGQHGPHLDVVPQNVDQGQDPELGQKILKRRTEVVVKESLLKMSHVKIAQVKHIQ